MDVKTILHPHLSAQPLCRLFGIDRRSRLGRRRYARAALIVALTTTVSACAGCRLVVPDDEEVVVVAYNVQNLFDAVAQGSEYDEFTPDAGWDAADVDRRLQRLGRALSQIRPAPDVVVLSEVENAALFDRLFEEHVVDLPLAYRAFVRGHGGATGVGIATRYPVARIRTLLARSGEQPSQRPVLEARLRLPTTDLVLFANHWKSKRGSAAGTEELRRAAARLVNTRLHALSNAEPDLPIIVAGDLNVQPRELELVGAAYPTALIEVETLRGWDVGDETYPEWYDDAWFASGRFLLVHRERATLHAVSPYRGSPVLLDLWSLGAEAGSYWYWDRWERIDHILANASAVDGPVLTVVSFGVVSFSDGVDAEGRPLGWEEGGVSDHLPIMARFLRKE